MDALYSCMPYPARTKPFYKLLNIPRGRGNQPATAKRSNRRLVGSIKVCASEQFCRLSDL